MQEIIERIKALETPQLIIYSAIILCVAFIAYGVFKPSSAEDSNTAATENFIFPDADKKQPELDTKMDAYNLKEERESTGELKFDRSLFGVPEDNDSTLSEASYYQQEEDPLVREMQSQIERMERQQQKRAQGLKPAVQESTPPKQTVRTDMSPTKEIEDPMQKELERYRRLRAKDDRPINKDKPESIKVRASIYNDQRIFPSDRVALLLNEDFSYGGKTFKKNTILYARSSFSKNRVLLDVNNIQHVPIQLKAIDLEDGRVGMYVQQVAEFNSKYNALLESQGVGTMTREVGSVIEQRGIGRIINSVGRLFSSKRLKDRDRVYLINDQQVYLTNANDQ